MKINNIKEINRKDSYKHLRNFNIRVDYVGMLSSEIFELNRLSENCIILYVLENSFKLKFENNIIELVKGDIYFLSNNLVLVENNNTSVMFISFKSVNIVTSNDLKDFLLSNINKISNDNNEHLKIYFDRIYNEANNSEFGYCEYVDSLLGILIINLFRLSKKSHRITKISSSSVYFANAQRYIRHHLAEPIKVTEIADNLNISQIYLYKIFKDHTNKSVQQFILDYKLNEAADLLESGDYLIKGVADKYGFSSSNHFSQSFKKKYGKSPKSFSNDSH
jgi:AraC-like DNA-binding protein